MEDAILTKIANGHSLRTICKAKPMPDRGTVLRWLDADEDFAAKYARARVQQADFLEEEMADIEDRTITGEIDPAAARAVLGSKQWRASKLAPKRYGDKLELSGDKNNPVLPPADPTDVARRIVFLLAQAKDAPKP